MFKVGEFISNGKTSGQITAINLSAEHYVIDEIKLIKFSENPVIATLPCSAHDSEPKQSLRLNSGKVQTREIDPAFILSIAEVLTKSRAKYDSFNWALPTKLSTPMESFERHFLAFKQGEDIDSESGCHHLAHCATNLMFMLFHLQNNKEYSDDRFFKKEKK